MLDQCFTSALRVLTSFYGTGNLGNVILHSCFYVIFLELPWLALILVGIAQYAWNRSRETERAPYFPPVSCIITCYSEKWGVRGTIQSLTEQLYPGKIQIIAVIDGAVQNYETYQAALSVKDWVAEHENRSIVVVPKWQRGGRVSGLNTGRLFVTGEIVMALDGDTSFNNNMVERATRHFLDPSVACVSGCLRVRNASESLCTELQAVEYFISIEAAKTGLSAFNMVNNISGAFGVFRKSVLDLIGGWDAGSAEDLDLTLRVKNYFGRYKKKFRIVFDPEAVGYTDVPSTFAQFFKQRMRWDGDLSYIYFRKHSQSFSPRLLGWGNFISILLSGLYTQIVVPFLIVLYLFWLMAFTPAAYSLSVLLMIYAFYLFILIFQYFYFIALLSEQPGEQLRRVIFLPLFPIFTLASRVNCLIATLWELFGQGHNDSSMAPWWVFKKNKFK